MGLGDTKIDKTKDLGSSPVLESVFNSFPKNDRQSGMFFVTHPVVIPPAQQGFETGYPIMIQIGWSTALKRGTLKIGVSDLHGKTKVQDITAAFFVDDTNRTATTKWNELKLDIGQYVVTVEGDLQDDTSPIAPKRYHHRTLAFGIKVLKPDFSVALDPASLNMTRCNGQDVKVTLRRVNFMDDVFVEISPPSGVICEKSIRFDGHYLNPQSSKTIKVTAGPVAVSQGKIDMIGKAMFNGTPVQRPISLPLAVNEPTDSFAIELLNNNTLKVKKGQKFPVQFRIRSNNGFKGKVDVTAGKCDATASAAATTVDVTPAGGIGSIMLAVSCTAGPQKYQLNVTASGLRNGCVKQTVTLPFSFEVVGTGSFKIYGLSPYTIQRCKYMYIQVDVERKDNFTGDIIVTADLPSDFKIEPVTVKYPEGEGGRFTKLIKIMTPEDYSQKNPVKFKFKGTGLIDGCQDMIEVSSGDCQLTINDFSDSYSLSSRISSSTITRVPNNIVSGDVKIVGNRSDGFNGPIYLTEISFSDQEAVKNGWLSFPGRMTIPNRTPSSDCIPYSYCGVIEKDKGETTVAVQVSNNCRIGTYKLIVTGCIFIGDKNCEKCKRTHVDEIAFAVQ